jgi:homoserine O-acetyltransferase
LLATNFADDLINPPELGIPRREIKRVKKGQAVVVPATKETVGHGTHTKDAVWKKSLEKFMKGTEGRGKRLDPQLAARSLGDPWP